MEQPLLLSGSIIFLHGDPGEMLYVSLFAVQSEQLILDMSVPTPELENDLEI